ncbi:MAG TPA: TonB-dependent receptor [Micropepsaceae bacterium]|nr:TonB-dependent receptor [Micropepsaceae bacterium]
MPSCFRHHSVRATRFGALLSSASLLATAAAWPAFAQAASDQVAQAAPAAAPAQTAQATPATVPEQVLVTGSLIHGAAAVGVPVTNLGVQDFKQTGALTTGDLFKSVPAAQVAAFVSSTDAGAQIERGQNVNLRGLSTKGARTLLLVDGYRFPPQGDGGCIIDPSIIPQLALDRVDVLADGASATYGSDAIAGVINVILRRGYEGAITEGSFGVSPGYGHDYYRGSVLYGTKWSSGDITLTYEYYQQQHVAGTKRSYFTMDFSPWGLDNRTSLANSRPGTISLGAPTLPANNPNTFTNTVTGQPVVEGTPGSFSATTGFSCGNCFAIPKGQNGSGLTWANILANTGTVPAGQNQINPFSNGWEQPDQARSGAVVTFDQNLLPGVQFFGDGFYSNRRFTILNATGPNSPAPAQNNALVGVAVPTTNPFYPVGAPTNLRVSYDFGLETPVHVSGGELAQRFDGGLNIDLPFNWTGKLYGVVTEDKESAIQTGLVNPGQVSAALGWTVPASAVLASFTKPAGVPYLNLFCDPTQFTCNSPATIGYITGFRNYREDMLIHEYGATADGSLFPLPGGDVKMAIGGVYDHYAFFDEDNENYNNPGTAQVSDATEYRHRTVWAGFAQLNVPIIGDANRLPFVQRLEAEGSIRYDHYSDFGGTTNPKVSIDWLTFDGLKLTGAWGTSFRAPSFQESGSISGATIQGLNQAAGAGSNNYASCLKTGTPAVPGSAAALLNPACGAGQQFLGGILVRNGAGLAAAYRGPDFVLGPEKAQNVSGGFDFAPDDPFLRGLDIQATYYFVRIRDKLQTCDVLTSRLDDPLYSACYITPANNPNFQNEVIALLGNVRSQLPATQAVSNIGFIADAATRNIGWQSTDGVDFSASYDFDAGDLGAWNTGIVGNYVIDNKSVTVPGQAPVSFYSSVINGTRDSGGRLHYRARLGWAGGPDGAFSATLFMNYIPNFGPNNTSISAANGTSVAPLCFLQGNTPCNAGGAPQFAMYNTQVATLSNVIPSMYTFDLSLGYNTGDTPANTYLKNIGLTLTINNLLNRQPEFQYAVATSSNTPHAFYNALSADQRFINFTITKSW